jgi:hypothetical protein
MTRMGLAGLCLALMTSVGFAEESLVFSATQAGQSQPEKLCVIGFDANGFWASEQLMTNSFPAPQVGLEPLDGRDGLFADVVASLAGKDPNIPWQDEAPEAPYVTITHVMGKGAGETRRVVYLAWGRAPAPVAQLFGDLGRYGMDCLPPTLR